MLSDIPAHPPIPVPGPPRWVGWALIAAFAAWGLINLQWGRGIGWDEVEFLRATDWIRQGQVPYRDFFEHHTPLTWFLMAPFEGLQRGPGVAPILWMRWLQVPLWTLTLWRMNIWMKEEGGSTFSRYFSLACLLGTPFFVFSALEYRVDTLGTLLVILALDALRRRGTARALVAGALLTASVLANLRFGPLAVLTAVAASSLDPEAREWRFQVKRLGLLALGGALALALWWAYLAATGAMGDFWHWCIVANKLASEAMAPSRNFGGYLLAPLTNGDLPGLALEGGMVAGAILALRSLRKPRFLHLLLLAQAANLAFVALMKVQYLYHFELSLCLAAPFLAHAMRSLSNQAPFRKRLWVGPAFLAFSLMVDGGTLIANNDHATLRYQDATLRQAAIIAPPGSTVLDGCGWLIEAQPAYRFWFLPLLVRVLCRQQEAAAYTPEAMVQAPPKLVIADTRIANLAYENPKVGFWIATHYLPVAPNLWAPGLSRVLAAQAPKHVWEVLVDGDYQVLCSPELVRHPWFSVPFAFVQPSLEPTESLEIDPATFRSVDSDKIHWRLDGKPVEPSVGMLHLSKGQALEADFQGEGATGVMLVPKGTGLLFRPPPPGITLDYVPFTSYWPNP